MQVGKEVVEDAIVAECLRHIANEIAGGKWNRLEMEQQNYFQDCAVGLQLIPVQTGSRLVLTLTSGTTPARRESPAESKAL